MGFSHLLRFARLGVPVKLPPRPRLPRQRRRQEARTFSALVFDLCQQRGQRQEHQPRHHQQRNERDSPSSVPEFLRPSRSRDLERRQFSEAALRPAAPRAASFSTYPARTFFNPSGSNKRREYSERRVVGYSMAEMFEVVSDVDKYEDFLPFCTRSEVYKRRGDSYFECVLQIGFPPFVESYNSVVECSRPHWLRVNGTDGQLFNHLNCEYRFSPGLPNQPRSCTLDFHVTYEFRSQVMATAADAAFDMVQRQQVEAFLSRAEKKFGRPSIVGGELR